jgi:hypothetical protein
MLFIDKPHNPLLNSGAIMSSALLLKLVHSHMEMSEKFDLVWKYFSKIAGKIYSKEDSISVEYRAVSCVFRNIDPPPTPLSTRRVCPPPATKLGGTHSQGGEGGGGSIFWKMKDIGLASYSNNVLYDIEYSLAKACISTP